MRRRSTLIDRLLLSLIFVVAPRALTAQELTVPSAEPPEEASSPWRVETALDLPDWLSISGDHRQRVAYVFNQFRAGRGDDDRLHSVRTRLRAEARRGRFRIGAELQDSRAYRLGDGSVAVDTTTTNPAELLEAYVRVDRRDDRGFLRAGRVTLNMGSRRFVARNRYRNTSNAFTGVEGLWEFESGGFLHGLFGLPVQRRPEDSDRSALESNRIEFDREDEEVVFWGLLGQLPIDALDSKLELFFYGLHEDDTSDRQTQDRELYTPGFRFFRTPSPGSVDVEVEAAAQFGSARGLRGVSLVRQDRRAYFGTVTAGYTFAHRWRPRVALEYLYATGDEDPNDGDDERFDTLYGARRWEYGPTGIYGAFQRSNVHSPGVRFQLRPRDDVSSFFAYRAFWLASKDDAWTTAGVRDPSGDSGRFLGHHLETRVRWNLIPDSLRLEAGAAWLIRGEFLHDAPNANDGGEPAVVYFQTTFTF